MPRTNATKSIVLLTLATALATADSKPPKPAVPRPAPTDPKLAQLVGRWEGTTRLTIRGETFHMKSAVHCERAAVGPAITCNAIIVGGERRLEETHLLGYDKASDRYHLFSVNNWGEAYDHAAKWTEPHRVSFVHDGMRDGKPLREVYAFEIRAKEMTMTGAISLDNKVFAEGVTTVKRVP